MVADSGVFFQHCRLCSIGLHLSSVKTLVVMVRLKSSLKCEANFKVKFESFIHGWLRSGLRKHHASGEKYLAINLMKNAKLGNITQAIFIL